MSQDVWLAIIAKQNHGNDSLILHDQLVSRSCDQLNIQTYRLPVVIVLALWLPVDSFYSSSSSLSGKKYPFYATQWHPEKNGFEWTTKEGINHSEHAVAIMQMTANFLVQEGWLATTSTLDASFPGH